MALTNYERVGKAMELLKDGLAPFVQREIDAALPNLVENQMAANDRMVAGKPLSQWDVSALLALMWDNWNSIFHLTLGNVERSLVSELRTIRNRWAHQEAFTSDDAYRALDSVSRLLVSVSAPEAEKVDRMKQELLRVVFEEQVRSERRKSQGELIDTSVNATLKPWREVVTPRADVASGNFQEAEFAADLWQVYLGGGTNEYRNPIEFFKRTYLTESLKNLLASAIKRLSGKGGNPVVQLQTNFGGGKTHSMLALYHLFSGIAPQELVGVEPILKETGFIKLPSVRRVVLVGNRLQPGNVSRKNDGTIIHTMWGELAWQLGGKEAYEKIRADDEHGTSPGDALRKLFIDYGPCLVLIDEWVAYARQLHDTNDLPAGTFDTQFSFAQALTESAKLAGNCLVVVSLPASDVTGSPHVQAEDVEVGGIRGREALDRLRNVIGRVESSWRPATAAEGFEIVRRRLFEPLAGPENFRDRDVVAREFASLYRTQNQEFPSECRESEYEKRIRDAYPIHPEVFERLYTDWSTLVKFQRTRGVLRLMAMVIHCLWEGNDRSPLIMPSTIPMNDPRVKSELVRYLSDAWPPIMESDVDGLSSLPAKLDSEVATLGKYSATRRVARTIYLGSAPVGATAHQGIEDRRIKLGCAMPGEPPAVFGDALRRLASQATHLYQDGNRFYYSLQPNVTKVASDRAELLLHNPDKVSSEIERRLREDFRERGDFERIHVFPQSGQDLPDDTSLKLAVLNMEQTYGKEDKSPAESYCREIFESRGSMPRLYRNTIVFLAPDRTRIQDLDGALRLYMAWDSIINEKETLDLTPGQVRTAESQLRIADNTVKTHIPEAYIWLFVPTQTTASEPIVFSPIKLSGQDLLAVRASKKLKNEEWLVTSLGPSRLRMEMDKIPLWRGNHVSISQLVEDFAKYVYLPRLKNTQVLLNAIMDGTGLLTWEEDSFAYADSYDEDTKRYRGLRHQERVIVVDESSTALLVKPEAAMQQIEAEAKESAKGKEPEYPGITVKPEGVGPGQYSGPVKDPNDKKSIAALPKRFHGSVILDQERPVRDLSQIMDEIVSHLQNQQGSSVKITLEIEASLPHGADEALVRTVLENSRTLKFADQGFENG